MNVTQLKAPPADELRLRVNAQRACDLVIRIVGDASDRLTCAAYAPRRTYNRSMILAVEDIAKCRVSQGYLLWIGSTCFTLTESEAAKVRAFVAPSVLRETP